MKNVLTIYQERLLKKICTDGCAGKDELVEFSVKTVNSLVNNGWAVMCIGEDRKLYPTAAGKCRFEFMRKRGML